MHQETVVDVLAFKKLTHEFEKDVIDAATIGDPGLIPSLLEQYNQDVRALDLIPKRMIRVKST